MNIHNDNPCESNHSACSSGCTSCTKNFNPLLKGINTKDREKLDENRVQQIIDLVNNDEFGQIFITDTHSERTENIVKQSNVPYQIFKL